MKILFINNNPEGKGTFWRCLGLANSLAKKGHQVTITCLQKRFLVLTIQREWRQGVEIIALPRVGGSGIKELPGHLLRAVYIIILSLRQNFDIVHTFNVASLTCGLPVLPLWLLKKAHLGKYEIVVDWDDFWGKGGLTSLDKQGSLVEYLAGFMEAKIPLLADKVTVVSEEICRMAVRFGVKPSNVTKIINGSPVDTVEPLDKIMVRRKLKMGVKDKIICFPAAMTANLRFVLNSFELIYRKRADVKLILVNPLTVKEQKLVLASSAAKNITLAGFQSYDRYLLYLAAADVVLIPRSNHILDRCEFPSRLGDVMALSRPVVMNKSGDAWKIVVDNEIGLVTPVDDPQLFAEAILKIIDNPKLAKKYSVNARNTAVGKYSWDKISQSLLTNVYSV